jgi:hypothetical protein
VALCQGTATAAHSTVLNAARTLFVTPLECPLSVKPDSGVVYFYTAASSRCRGAMWSIFAPALTTGSGGSESARPM